MKRNLLSLSLLACAAAASAVPITYTMTATGSGSLNGNAYSDALITLTGVGDTDGLVVAAPNYRYMPVTATVSVAGFGSDVFTTATDVFLVPGVGVGFQSAPYGNDILDSVNPAAYATYDLVSDFGPVTGDPLTNPGYQHPTVGGNFVIDTVGPSTFTATTEAVPEPASLAALGLAGLALCRRRRRA